MKILPGSADGFTRTVLVVEDDEAVLRFVCQAVEQLGYRCFGAVGAAAAQSILKKTDIDLLITDVNMPGIDGTQLVTSLAAAHRQLPVIFMSGDPAPHHLWSLGRRVIFLRKPFTIPALGHEIEQMFER